MSDERGYGWGTDEDGRFITFDGKYGRTGHIRVTDTVCTGCRKAAMCVYVDQSDGEYYPGTICRECIARLFGEPAKFELVGNSPMFGLRWMFRKSPPR